LLAANHLGGAVLAFKDGLFDSFDSVLVYLRQCVHNKSIYVLTKLTFYSGLKRQIPDDPSDWQFDDGLAVEADSRKARSWGVKDCKASVKCNVKLYTFSFYPRMLKYL
jgi:hypothetical protein